jgi:hypothetical protein
MSRAHGRPAAWLLACTATVAACLCWSAPARASYEEFETLDVARQEEDDENLLDHVLVEPPAGWRDEWEQATGAFRSSQGCFTSGQWYIDNEFKVRVPMGDTTYFDLGLREVSDDESVYGWTAFDLRFPIGNAGLWGLRFRPTFDKSKQDAAVLWDHGNGTTAFQLKAALGLEDVFNKLWALRQARVGDDIEPYERHPFEPALALAWRGGGPRIEVAGKWLTPSRKRFETLDPALRRRERLWGAKGNASLSQAFGPFVGSARVQQVQASRFAVWEQRTGDHHLFARRWRTEAALTRNLGAHGSITMRWFYQERTQVYRPPLGNATFSVIDRMPAVEGAFRPRGDLGVRTGFMRNRVTVVNPGALIVSPFAVYGTRFETRAFFSVEKRFGHVRIQGTECVELDHESYPVAFHHDKGFIHIQAIF